MAKKIRKRKLDFTNVKDYVFCPEGQHVVKMTEITEEVSQAGNDMLNATFQVIKGEATGAKLYDNFVITQKALWKLKSYLACVGMKSEGKVVLNLDKLVGTVCIAEVYHEDYQGKTRSRINTFLPVGADEDDDDYDEDEDEFEDDEDEEEEEEKPKKSKKKSASKSKKSKKKAKKKPEPEEDDDDEDEWEDDDDE